MMIKKISRKLQAFIHSLVFGAGMLATQAVWAVNDLPGGPAVRQLNLHPPVTKIAEEQHWLHWYIMII